MKYFLYQVQNIVPADSLQYRGIICDNGATISSLCNYLPLCSRSEGDEGSWGCSERLERARVEMEVLSADTDAENSTSRDAHLHMIDWMVENFPHRLHEICIRLQLAYGDDFGLPVGDTLCLRFVRDVYGFRGSSHCEATDCAGSASIDHHLGFRADILDLAECFRGHTDRDMLSIVEKKQTMTPCTLRKRRRPIRRIESSNCVDLITEDVGSTGAPERGAVGEQIAQGRCEVDNQRERGGVDSTAGGTGTLLDSDMGLGW